MEVNLIYLKFRLLKVVSIFYMMDFMPKDIYSHSFKFHDSYGQILYEFNRANINTQIIKSIKWESDCWIAIKE